MYKVLGHSACTYCKQAILHLASKGYSFQYLDAREPENTQLVTALKNQGISTVPQIWFNDERIGGFDELRVRV